MKFALICSVLPPSETSVAGIIYRLLREFDPDSYCLISSKDYTGGGRPDYSGRLAGKYYYLPPTYQLTRGHRFGLARLRERLNPRLALLLRAGAIARILRREKCEAVVGCSVGVEPFDFPAGYLASRLAGARFYAYLLDQYSHMLEYMPGYGFMGRLEARMMRGAAAVITPNEFQRDDVRRRFGVEPVVIHNPCDLSEYARTETGARPAEQRAGDRREISILYTGAMSQLHFQGFRNLITALESLGREDVKIHIYTAQPAEPCRNAGVRGPSVVYHEHEALSAIAGIQQSADILFLPLGFTDEHRDTVRTAAPGKMGEYLAARRPILAHAPADSFIAWYFRRYECGLLVDRDDPEELARALSRLLSDGELRERLAARAWERAVADFDLEKARAQFAELVGSK